MDNTVRGLARSRGMLEKMWSHCVLVRALTWLLDGWNQKSLDTVCWEREEGRSQLPWWWWYKTLYYQLCWYDSSASKCVLNSKYECLITSSVVPSNKQHKPLPHSPRPPAPPTTCRSDNENSWNSNWTTTYGANKTIKNKVLMFNSGSSSCRHAHSHDCLSLHATDPEH